MLVLADGFTPKLSARTVDPRAGPASLTLSAHNLDKRDPTRVFRGRVLGDDGLPLRGASVEPVGFWKGEDEHFGGLKGFDSLAVTDNQGMFRLGVPESGLELNVHVSAPFYAPRRFQRLAVNAKGHDLALVRGVTVRGRLLKNGKPLAGGAMGLVQKNRDIDTFVGPSQAASTEDGTFSISNQLPDETLLLYGLMDSLRPHGAVPARELRAGKSGTTLDVGDVEVKPGYRLVGQLVLADGKAVPAGTRLLLSRHEAWDTQQMVVDKNGGFAFEGLPPEGYSLTARVPNYHLSEANESLDPLNSFRLCGMIQGNTEELRLLFTPGSQPPLAKTSDQDVFKEQQRRFDAPLRGAPKTSAGK